MICWWALTRSKRDEWTRNWLHTASHYGPEWRHCRRSRGCHDGQLRCHGSFVFCGWIMQMAAFRATTTGEAPPTAPTNLSATAVGTSQINLTWTASTDPIGVTGYIVQRCQGAGCTVFTQVATPTSTTYSDTGLSPSTSYSYQVQATDATGDLSAFSNIATATTQSGLSTISFVQSNYVRSSGFAIGDRSIYGRPDRWGP